MDEALLYGDLEAFGDAIDKTKLQQELDETKKANIALEAENTQLRAQISVLVADRAQLETNIGNTIRTILEHDPSCALM